MRFPPKIQLPPELLSELTNAFRFDFRWSILRVSSSIFDHFLAKRQQKIIQNVHLYFKQHFFSHLNVPMHEAVVAARVLSKFQMGNFKEMYSPLFPVDKYRLRKKHPFPRTILSEEKVYSFKEQDRKILKKYYLNDAYPNQAVRKQLAQETGFMIMQVVMLEIDSLVDNWFKNRRQRDKKQQQKMSADYSPRIAKEIKAQKQIMADAKKVFEAATARLEQLEQKQQQQAQNLSPAKMPPAELEKKDEIFGSIEKKKRKETDE